MSDVSDIREPSGGSIFFAALGIGVLFLLFGGLLYVFYLPAHREATTAPVFSAAEMKEMEALSPSERDARLQELRWERRVPNAEDRRQRLLELRDQEAAALANYSWIDQNQGTVRLPIERAMELVIQEQSRGKRAATP